jgi:hypothetical protein
MKMARMIKENDQWILRDDWSIEDVRNVIECNEIEDAENFTDEDCVRALQIAADAFDANIGINWDVIDCAILFVIKEK